jgi:hypothetical protein
MDPKPVRCSECGILSRFAAKNARQLCAKCSDADQQLDLLYAGKEPPESGETHDHTNSKV